MHKLIAGTMLLAGMATGLAVGAFGAAASDHDDGTTNMKTQNTNLTDLYVFRKDKATGNAADADHLVVALNLNPRSLPRQNYFFNTKARYTVHFSHVGENPGTTATFGLGSVDDLAPTGADDFSMTYTFGEPTANVQNMTISAQRGGTAMLASGVIASQPMRDADLVTGTNSADPPQTVTLDGATVRGFAGLRQDPFFFDVERFFMVRDRAVAKAEATTTQPYIGFRATGKDFVANYNVLSVVTEFPISLVQGTASTANVFDTWATIDVLSL